MPRYYLNLSEVFTAFTEYLVRNNDLTVLRLAHSRVEGIRLKWKTSSLMKILPPLSYLRPTLNLNLIVPTVRSRFQEVSPPCSHKLPSWVVCWICSPAPSLFLPGLYRADHGLSEFETRGRREGDTILRTAGVFIDYVATLSAFNALEADPNYPYNCPASRTLPNSYGSLPALREALWRTIVGDSTSHGGSPTPAYYAILLTPDFWAPRGVHSLPSPGLDFSLGAFMTRDKRLILGGYELRELIPGANRYLRRPRYYRHRGRFREPLEANTRDAHTWATNVLAWRRLVGTRRGRVGLTVAAVHEGDSIVVLKGCGMPMVLRPSDSGH